MLDGVQESVGVIKIGLELFVSKGPAVIRMVQKYRKPVFLDLKVLDVAETVQRTTARVADMEVSFLTVHAERKAAGGFREGTDRQSWDENSGGDGVDECRACGFSEMGIRRGH